MLTFDGISADLRERVGNVESAPRVYDYGEVVSSADGIAHVTGLSGVRYGELLDFGNGAIGVTMDVVEDKTGVAVIDGEVSTASVARMTGRIAEVAVGYELLGRVVDPLGRPLDGDPLPVHKMRPLESAAPSIMHRANVDTPLETGILAIDSMIPIGRGQRELIIGDRQTGKTSIALQTILSQKGRGVLCVYCAIGQKASSVASVVKTLSDADALEYTVVVTANASSSAAMQYLAPYAACAIAEEFMYSGRDALVIYDDLSKHAAAYRALSLLLRRPSGREAYPGDVFYLHSRLLERAARMSEELGGGSLTALPIVETMAGDISAYIPTNVISITDGQIYLESDLFSAGQRPAVNVGLSVSRVGRAAQSKAMRDVSGALRLDVAQYNEMAVFAQFGADVDSATANMLRSGEAVMELLRQPETQLYTLADQVALLLAKTIGLFANMPRRDVREASALLLQRLHDVAGGVMRNIQITGKLEPTDREIITHEIEAFAFYKTITTPPEPERKGAVKDTDYVKR
ncbi:MAG: F0F1 ATP synthase subunit alpha [Oscillospiraceae bacterium]|nr:F0F1 ATP synthase subunit alpha [Oscillospiraceae bacterium]